VKLFVIVVQLDMGESFTLSGTIKMIEKQVVDPFVK